MIPQITSHFFNAISRMSARGKQRNTFKDRPRHAAQKLKRKRQIATRSRRQNRRKGTAR